MSASASASEDNVTGSEAEEAGEDSPLSEPADEELDDDDIDEDAGKDVAFNTYKMFVFACCFLANCLFLYNRRVLQFVLPNIMSEGEINGFDITLIVMFQQVSFSISSFCIGLYLDKYSAKTVLAIGCFLTGFFNFGLSDIDDPPNLILLATMSGISQGIGWPACVKIIRVWFPATSFGFWWSLINQSFFLVEIVGPLMASHWAYEHGWRTSVQMPAVISMVVSFALYFCNFDKPSDVGYLDQKFLRKKSNLHWTDFLGNEFMLVLSGAGFLMTMVKQTSADWGQLYLMEERGLSAHNAGYYNFSMQCGGALGTIVVGSMADFSIKRKFHLGYYRFPRMILLFASLFGGGLILSTVILGLNAYSSMLLNYPKSTKQECHRLIGTLNLGFRSNVRYSFEVGHEPGLEVNIYAFLMGFTFSAALQNIEVLVIETAPPNKCCACFAILNFANALAILMSGFPMSFIAAAHGWNKAFLFLNFSLLVAFFGTVIGKDLDQSFVPIDNKLKQK